MYSVYYIKNKYSGAMYVGSSVNYGRRRTNHLYRMRLGTHKNRRIQKDYYKYGGEDAFEFFEICKVRTRKQALQTEQIFIDGFRPTYNILRKAGSAKGRKYTQVTLDRMSKSAKERKQVPPGTAKLSETDVFGILKEVDRGRYYRLIAKDYGVTKSAITAIANRYTWKDIYDEHYKNEKAAVI